MPSDQPPIRDEETEGQREAASRVPGHCRGWGVDRERCFVRNGKVGIHQNLHFPLQRRTQLPFREDS